MSKIAGIKSEINIPEAQQQKEPMDFRYWERRLAEEQRKNADLKAKEQAKMELQKLRELKPTSAEALSRIAMEASRLGNMWLEHWWIVEEAHRKAANAHDLAGNHGQALEHTRSANYWHLRIIGTLA